MGGFAALLIGASDYERVGFTPLPFVPRDLERLDAALRARGFRVERPGAGERISWNFVNGEVSRFLEKARRGETLLICLSGHGLHAQGVDYLIPEDLHRYRKPLWSGCVAIDWRSEVENTRAAQVLFLIDACREGVGGDTMAGAVGWASGRAMTVKSRRIAHLYACSPGGYAHFVAAGSGSFSLFSRAVLDELLAYDGPLTLEQLGEAVQNRIEVLHTAHGKPGSAQEVRVLTDADQGSSSSRDRCWSSTPYRSTTNRRRRSSRWPPSTSTNSLPAPSTSSRPPGAPSSWRSTPCSGRRQNCSTSPQLGWRPRRSPRCGTRRPGIAPPPRCWSWSGPFARPGADASLCCCWRRRPSARRPNCRCCSPGWPDSPGC